MFKKLESGWPRSN